MNRYRYRYIGDYPCYTVDPAADWQPGDERDVEKPIDHPLFVPVTPARGKPTDRTGDPAKEE